MKPFVNNFDFTFSKTICCEPPTTLPSQTIPGQTLSLQTLLERYVRGENVEVFNATETPLDIPEAFERMTEQDKLDYARELKSAAQEAYLRAGRQKPPAKQAPGEKPTESEEENTETEKHTPVA